MRYRHYKGGEYEFVTLALMEARPMVVVVYRSLKDGTAWVRPAEEFFGRVEAQPRFSLVPPEKE